MKNLKLSLILLAIVCAALICISCGDDTTETTADPADTTTVATTKATTKETTKATTKATTVTTTAATTAAPGTISVNWNLGYVGSSTNSQNFVNKLNPNGGSYSYTDVFNVAKAGTTITFIDDNTNSNGDSKFASAAAYVFSSWKQEGGEWVIDMNGANFPGSNANASEIATPGDGIVTYSYTTTKDNENLRICFRSGQSTSFTPAAYPTISVVLPK